MKHAGVLTAGVLALLAVSHGAAQAPSLPPSCGPMGDLRFVCGPDGPEDLVAVPRTPWLVASAFNGSGGLYVIDTTKSTSTKVFPTAASAERMDTRTYASCPGPLRGEDRTSFRTHGLDLIRRGIVRLSLTLANSREDPLARAHQPSVGM